MPGERRCGFRDTPAADLDALFAVLVAVSQLLADVPEIAELDINPLILRPEGAMALDARISVSAKAPGGAEHFAIRPYPSGLCETVEWQGRTLTLRAIRTEDEAQYHAFLTRLSPEDVRMRVFYSRRSIECSEVARMTQIDYERETATVAVAPGPNGVEEALSVARALADLDNIDEHSTRRLAATVLSHARAGAGAWVRVEPASASRRHESNSPHAATGRDGRAQDRPALKELHPARRSQVRQSFLRPSPCRPSRSFPSLALR